MSVEVRVPTILRALTGGEKVVTASGDTLAAVVADLDGSYPGMGARLLDDSGLRRFVNIYVNDEDVRFLAGLQTQIADQDSITILPAVAGGRAHAISRVTHTLAFFGCAVMGEIGRSQSHRFN